MKRISRYLLGGLFVVAGVNHFVFPRLYLRIMPPYIPWHLTMVYVSGACEIALGAAMFRRRLARPAAWGLVALLAAVFPANVYMAQHPELFPRIRPALAWARLPFQAVFMAWAYWHTRPETSARPGTTSEPLSAAPR